MLSIDGIESSNPMLLKLNNLTYRSGTYNLATHYQEFMGSLLMSKQLNAYKAEVC